MKIRKAKITDSESIAKCLLLAMEDIVCKLIGKQDSAEALKFLQHFVAAENCQYSYQNCWVVEDEKGIVAAACLYDGALLNKLRKPVIKFIEQEFNVNISVEDETREGEYYLDSLGVLPNEQGRGIGTKLLKFLIDEHVKKHHRTLGLLVEEENEHAMRIYLKLGFWNVGKQTLLGKQMIHLQVEKIPEYL